LQKKADCLNHFGLLPMPIDNDGELPISNATIRRRSMQIVVNHRAGTYLAGAEDSRQFQGRMGVWPPMILD
jgi:hypothetical protein